MTTLQVGAASAQMLQAWQSMFQTADADGNGQLSTDEFNAAMQTQAAGAAGAQGPPSANRNWSVGGFGEARGHRPHHRHEASQIGQSALAVLLQAQGQSDETASAATASDVMSRLIKGSDSDGDGKLSLSEFASAASGQASTTPTARAQAAFTSADADGDGFVTPDELATALQTALRNRLGESATGAYNRLINALDQALPASTTASATGATTPQGTTEVSA